MNNEYVVDMSTRIAAHTNEEAIATAKRMAEEKKMNLKSVETFHRDIIMDEEQIYKAP